MTPPAVSILTLGCKVNQCDADEMASALAARGCRVIGRGQPADIYIVNTCTVTATADAKARKLIRKLRREHPEAHLIVTGCWAQRDAEGVAAALPEVNLVVPNTRKREIAAIVVNLSPADSGLSSPAPRARTRAFLKIQDGCDHRCTYCIVPHVRGRPTSTSMPEVIRRVEELVEAKAKELVLCGIRLGAYGRDLGDTSLAQLLRALRGTPIPRIRLSSIEPMDAGEDLLVEIADHPSFCHHLHLPLQSGDDELLAAMGRGYTAADFAALVGRVRRVLPDATITTDIVVGFPGETEEQFKRSADFIGRIGASRVHVFPYSPRPGTPAARLPGQVSSRVRRERTECMLAVARHLARAAARTWVGRTVSVLFEEREADGNLRGLTEQYMRLYCRAPASLVGQIAEVAPTQEIDGALLAEPQSPS